MEKIPKVIHYCWFGGAKKPDIVRKCIQSWKNKMPDYQIVEWNEENFDIRINKFTLDAYSSKKWAFVSDYCRLWVLYNYGGIYLDTDMEVVKSLDDFLVLDSFGGVEMDKYVNVAIWGCKKEDKFIKDLLDYYQTIDFKKNLDNLKTVTIPVIVTNKLKEFGFELKNKPIKFKNISIFPKEYFYPKNHSWETPEITSNTYTIHHYEGSWRSSFKIYRSRLKGILVRLVGVNLANKITKIIKT